MFTQHLPHPTDMPAIRRLLAENTPDVAAVHTCAGHLLADVGEVPTLGGAAWCALAPTDPRRVVAFVRPALAYLAESQPAVIAERLRSELDAFATAQRRVLAETSHDVSEAWAELGYGVGPSYAELVRRRAQGWCLYCQKSLPVDVPRCSCGRQRSAEEIRSHKKGRAAA